jgi:hypothetical protein
MIFKISHEVLVHSQDNHGLSSGKSDNPKPGQINPYNAVFSQVEQLGDFLKIPVRAGKAVHHKQRNATAFDLCNEYLCYSI